ncbi:MAG TPA: ABC transporter ATP-binding protein [Acidimicrobiales bacterium]|nr:ABC transporter ATP-binding protein [Acidimicrobiales bacterium]
MRDRNTDDVREAQRHAEYAYKLAVDPPAAKELRLFGLAGWTIERFVARRTQLVDLQYRATRLRQRPLIWSLLLVAGANVVVFWSLASAVIGGRLDLAGLVVFAQVAVGTSAIAFGGLNWAMDGATAPVVAVLRLEAAMPPRGALSPPPSPPVPAADMPAREVRFRDVTFAYPASEQPVLEGFDLTIPAGSSLAIVGQNGAGKTTLAKLLCRLYDPQAGTIEVDGVDLAAMAVDDWRSRVTAVFQDFFRFELPARQSVGVGDEPRLDDVLAVDNAVARAGAQDVVDRLPAGLETQLGPTWPGGVEVSFGQWQKLALGRGFMRDDPLVLVLDEPTAALDAETEHALFERYTAAARRQPVDPQERDTMAGADAAAARTRRITILVSHRFSIVRMADLIVVLDGSRVVEVGAHADLVARGGQYAELYGIQAAAYK